MPKPSPIPKKFMSQLEDAQGDLRKIANQSRNLLKEMESSKIPMQSARSILRDIEATAYRIALDLSEVDIASGCDTCPAAPARTKYQAHLFALSCTLQQQANLARRCAEGTDELDGVLLPSSLSEG